MSSSAFFHWAPTPTPAVSSFPLVIPFHTASLHHTLIPHFLGFQSKELIVKAGLALGDVDQHPTIDVTIDGADE